MTARRWQSPGRGFVPSRSRGQCFLTSREFVERIVQIIAPVNDEPLVEIGPGTGQLSFPLLSAGANLTAIETDETLVDELRSRLAEQAGDHFEVVHDDILRLDLAGFLGERFDRPVRVCGNLPYSVASAILLALLEVHPRLADMTLMFQLEVAERLVASPGTKAYGYLSVVTQQLTEPTLALQIPPEAFRPRPKVLSGLVRLRMRPEPPSVGDPDLFRTVVKGLFAHRRKTIANNLGFFRSLGFDISEVRDGLERLGIAASLRAEMLSVDEFAAISRFCASLR